MNRSYLYSQQMRYISTLKLLHMSKSQTVWW